MKISNFYYVHIDQIVIIRTGKTCRLKITKLHPELPSGRVILVLWPIETIHAQSIRGQFLNFWRRIMSNATREILKTLHNAWTSELVFVEMLNEPNNAAFGQIKHMNRGESHTKRRLRQRKQKCDDVNLLAHKNQPVSPEIAERCCCSEATWSATSLAYSGLCSLQAFWK